MSNVDVWTVLYERLCWVTIVYQMTAWIKRSKYLNNGKLLLDNLVDLYDI